MPNNRKAIFWMVYLKNTYLVVLFVAVIGIAIPEKFYDINFVNIKYNKFDASGWPPMDSGLLGPVYLTPSTLMEHSVL